MRATWFVKLLDSLSVITSSTVLNPNPLTMGVLEAYALIKRYNSAADTKNSCTNFSNTPRSVINFSITLKKSKRIPSIFKDKVPDHVYVFGSLLLQ
jgi:hypothetical protein